MMTNKITVFPATHGGIDTGQKAQHPRARLCALAVQIEAGADHGRWCLWYRIRLPSAELQEQLSEVRRHCLRVRTTSSGRCVGLLRHSCSTGE